MQTFHNPILDLLAALDGMRALDHGRRDPHRHRCPDPSCRHIWSHDRADIHSDAQNEAAHTCPACGNTSDGCWLRYHGGLPCSEAPKKPRGLLARLRERLPI